MMLFATLIGRFIFMLSRVVVRPTQNGSHFTASLIFCSLAIAAINARADFLYATREDGTVTQIDTVTHAVTTYVSGLAGAGGLAFDKWGDLYVTSYLDNSIVRFTPNGVGTVFASGVNNPAGVAIDAAGDIYVASYVGNGGGVIERFTPNSVGTVFASGLNGPLDPVFDKSGNLYVSNYYSGTVERITPSGVSSIFASGLNGPVGLAFDSSGDLYVSTDTDSEHQTITRYTPGGVGSVFASTMPYYPDGLAFDSSGNLYVGHDGDGLITEISPDGSQSTFSTGNDDTTSFLAMQPASVPEPSGTALLLIGISLLTFYRARRHWSRSGPAARHKAGVAE